MWGPPSYKLVYKPHEYYSYYSYLRTINHSEIGVILFAPTERYPMGGPTLWIPWDPLDITTEACSKPGTPG